MRSVRLHAAWLGFLASSGFLLAQTPDTAVELLARVGAERADCPESTREQFRPTVELICGTVDDEFKAFRKSWKQGLESGDGPPAGLLEATRWFRDGPSRRRYYWDGQLPLLVQFDDSGLIVLARYDVHATCRERARQLDVRYREARQLRRDGIALERVRHVAPVFPEEARQAQQGGVVLLWGVVNEQGTVEHLCIAGAQPRGHGFELAAMEAVRQWTYAPLEENGSPVPAELLTRVTFELGLNDLPYRDLLDPFFAAP